MWLSKITKEIPTAIKEILVDSGPLAAGEYSVNLCIEDLYDDPFLLREITAADTVVHNQIFHTVRSLSRHLDIQVSEGTRIQVLSTSNGKAEGSVSLSLRAYPVPVLTQPKPFKWWFQK